MTTNYERYFGTPEKAAESISRLVDSYDWLRQHGYEGEDYRSEFTDHFRAGGDCPYGLCHSETLAQWLKEDWDCWVLEKRSKCPSEIREKRQTADKSLSGDLLDPKVFKPLKDAKNVQTEKGESNDSSE